MIKDTLNANPGMHETCRAYSRVQYCYVRLEQADRALHALQLSETDRGLVGSLSDVEATVFRLTENLDRAKQEVRRCLKNEEALRLEQGLAPLDSGVLQSAEEFFKKHEYVLKSECSLV